MPVLGYRLAVAAERCWRHRLRPRTPAEGQRPRKLAGETGRAGVLWRSNDKPAGARLDAEDVRAVRRPPEGSSGRPEGVPQ